MIVGMLIIVGMLNASNVVVSVFSGAMPQDGCGVHIALMGCMCVFHECVYVCVCVCVCDSVCDTSMQADRQTDI